MLSGQLVSYDFRSWMKSLSLELQFSKEIKTKEAADGRTLDQHYPGAC